MAAKIDAKFPGAEKHEISLEEAKKHIQRHKKNPVPHKHNGGSFHRGIFDKILDHPECDGIRYYYAQKEDGTPTLVLVGINATGADLTKGAVAEGSLPCPPYCDASSQLI